MPRLVATNTLYVVRCLTTSSGDERTAWAMWLLTSEAAERLQCVGRRYADGLLKYEPRDLAELPFASAVAHMWSRRFVQAGHQALAKR